MGPDYDGPVLRAAPQLPWHDPDEVSSAARCHELEIQHLCYKVEKGFKFLGDLLEVFPLC